jgi:hypothetical protein
MKINKVLLLTYLAAVGATIIITIEEEYLGIGSILTLMLTLPWSLTMLLFMWTLIHNGASSLLIFLVPFAVLNAFLIYRLTNQERRNRLHDKLDA